MSAQIARLERASRLTHQGGSAKGRKLPHALLAARSTYLGPHESWDSRRQRLRPACATRSRFAIGGYQHASHPYLEPGFAVGDVGLWFHPLDSDVDASNANTHSHARPAGLGN